MIVFCKCRLVRFCFAHNTPMAFNYRWLTTSRTPLRVSNVVNLTWQADLARTWFTQGESDSMQVAAGKGEVLPFPVWILLPTRLMFNEYYSFRDPVDSG